MLWLNRRLRRCRSDRGAVAVLVAILFSGGVLLGMGALVIDVGGLYSERAQLQNGADAAALAVAMGCAKGTPTCDAGTGATSLAGKNANGNANDGKTTVDRVCGSGGNLVTCAAGAFGCESQAPAGNYAQVQTSTLTSSGSTILPPVFAQALTGQYSGETVRACARASWSYAAPAGLGNTVAFTISYCEWQLDTNSGASFATYPPWPHSYLDVYNKLAPAAGSEAVLTLHGDSGSTSCNSGNDSAGWDAPGAFGWVGSGSSCTVSITNNTYPANTGNNALTACVSTFQNAYDNKSPIYIPVYGGTTGTGSNVQYTLQGFAEFMLTGWDLTSGNSGWASAGGTVKASSLISSKDYCKTPYVASNSDVCVYGFFTKGLIPASDLPTGSGQDLGATYINVKMTG